MEDNFMKNSIQDNSAQNSIQDNSAQDNCVFTSVKKEPVSGKKIQNLKNDIFKENIKDPNNGWDVKEIWVQKKMKDTQFKKDRYKWDIEWQYYRHRGKQSITDFLVQNKGKTIRVTYFGDPVRYIIELDLIKGEIPKTVTRIK